ncbi:nucleotidyl transferase AbiEii/AbiGii toxin family protein [Gemmatimonas sp.]|uniref:nucleotidyl transferase AbiEii/AbiGii toxin family protein n=1 Tax=Gemmatimonas sp. TaxID=1962908 RepID=UPI003F707EDF
MGEQPAPVRLKGGVNLRLFHASPRYSEDMDFDVIRARGPQFVRQLRRVLTEPGAFRAALLKQGIEDLRISEVDGGGLDTLGFKQKVRLIRGGVELPTKVEASYRGETAAEEAIALPIPRVFVEAYGLHGASLIASYPAPVAIWQKALALSRRDPPQTRDIYDLQHLLEQSSAETVERACGLIRSRMSDEQRMRAVDTVAEFTKEQFESQVVQFLPQELRQQTRDEWDDRQERGWEWLSSLSEAPVTQSAEDPSQEAQDA